MRNGPSRVRDKLRPAGLVLDGATPAERAWFLSGMPPPARLLRRLIGVRQYGAPDTNGEGQAWTVQAGSRVITSPCTASVSCDGDAAANNDGNTVSW